MDYHLHKVVKLFNTIQQSQANAAVAAEEVKTWRGSGRPTLPAPVINGKMKGKVKAKDKDNAIGRGKESKSFPAHPLSGMLNIYKGAVGRDDFFNMIRSGGVVSKI